MPRLMELLYTIVNAFQFCFNATISTSVRSLFCSVFSFSPQFSGRKEIGTAIVQYSFYTLFLRVWTYYRNVSSVFRRCTCGPCDSCVASIAILIPANIH